MPKIPNPSSHTFTVLPRGCLRFCAGVSLALAWLAVSAAQAQTTNYTLGTASLLEGSAAGTDSVVLGVTPPSASWTNTANATWLHLSQANQSGSGSTNVIFAYDANQGATRSGTLTIAGQTLTVTQAGSTYVAAGSLTNLVSSGLTSPQGVAADGAGNVYIADWRNNAIKKWTAAKSTVTTLVSSGLGGPFGVAVDGAGNVYIADTGNNAIKEWSAAKSNVTTLVSSGLNTPQGVAVDRLGNVYIADTFNHAIKEWSPINSNVTTLVASGLTYPVGVAVDGAGNVYIADTGNNAIKEWSPVNSNVTTLVSSGLTSPVGVAVDGGGNVYIAGSGYGSVKEWWAASNTVTPLVSSALPSIDCVAVDGVGNVFIGNSGTSGNFMELPRAFVDPTPRLEGPAAGSDALPVVLPATELLSGPFAPISSDPSWLTISGISNGVVSFAFTATTSNRTAFITLLSQTIAVTQGCLLGTTARLEGPGAGLDSVVLVVYPNSDTWTATANAAWLHLTQPNQSGTGSTNVIFSFDANPGATRSGTLTIGTQTLTVTQAGSTYFPASPLTILGSAVQPSAVAVDGMGNVYFADVGNVIKKWTLASNTVTKLVSSGLNQPWGLAVDGAGNVYIADAGNNAIKKRIATSGTVTNLVSSGLAFPAGVALDGAGNVYIADTDNGAIKKWTVANSKVTTLVSSGLNQPLGVALDAAGNVYIADSLNGAIKEWTVANSNVTILVSSGLSFPAGLAVDGGGNVYIADAGSAIYKWTSANGNVTTLLSLAQCYGAASDSAGNVYIAAKFGNNLIEELPYAFVDPTPRLEGLAAGSDALPVVLPATQNLLPPFAPTSDQSWLTITSAASGVVGFSFTANAGLSRTAHITLLGQTIPITQSGVTPPTLTSAQMLANGACQFCFTNTAGASFTVLSTTDLSLPLSNWTVAGTASNTSPGQFQFTTQPITNGPQSYYIVRSP